MLTVVSPEGGVTPERCRIGLTRRVLLCAPDWHGVSEFRRHRRPSVTGRVMLAVGRNRSSEVGRPVSTRRGHAPTEFVPPVDVAAPDPRHIFLTSAEVMARYRWGRTKGYEQLHGAAFPKPIAGRYRLDLLMAWEDEQLASSMHAATADQAGPPAKRRPSRRASS